MFNKQVSKSLRRHAYFGLSVVALLTVGMAGWAYSTNISGAVVATGQLVVSTTAKKVQHLTGGIVGELLVRNGSHVKAGDVLIRLDPTQTKAELDIVLAALDENAVRRARREAELSGVTDIVFPAEILARISDEKINHLVTSERKLFDVRRLARDGQKQTLQEQIKGFRDQITGKDKELDWIKQELAGVRGLWEKNLVPFTRVVSLERDAARIVGERGALIASIAQAELKILQVDEDMRTEVSKEMADIRAKNSEFLEKRVSAQDKLDKIEIRAPQDGYVHALQVHTVGGVIAPPNTASEPIMLIVPERDELVVEAKVKPEDISQVHMGQKTFLRLTSFNQRTTPEFKGEVMLVSADIVEAKMSEQRREPNHYVVRVKLSDEAVTKFKLVPGMPVETFIQTDDRTALSYLVKPMQDQIMRAFRER
jgi:membrane fusion protein, type I secretion system